MRPIRINITGNAGAGKTTLAREFGQALGVPVYSLDRIVWQPGWKKTPMEQRLAAERELVSGPAWVIDGVSRVVRDASDLVLLLDVPRHVCVWRGLRRSLRYAHRTRPEMPADCPEWRIVPRLLQIIRRFPANAGAAIRAEASLTPAKFRVVQSSREAQEILRDLLAAAQLGAATDERPVTALIQGRRLRRLRPHQSAEVPSWQ